MCRIPAEDIPEGAAGGAISTSRYPIYETKDAGRGLYLRLNNTCKQFNVSADFVHASKRGIKNHCRDAFQYIRDYGHLAEGADVMNSVLQQFLFDT